MIVCNGEPPSLDLLQNLWNQADLRICADGGANFVIQQGLRPDVVVGDLDSIASATRQALGSDCLISVEEQDTNDGDKTVRYCLQQNVSEVHMLGASGGRSDQFFANVELLYKYSSQLKIRLWTALDWIEVIEQKWEGVFRIGTTVSLLPMFGPVYGITTTGLAYPLCSNTLEMGKVPSGVSNRVESVPVRITIEEGKLLLIVQRKTGSEETMTF